MSLFVKTRASVLSESPNSEKLIKAVGRRPSDFVAYRCLEPLMSLMKHEARVSHAWNLTATALSV